MTDTDTPDYAMMAAVAEPVPVLDRRGCGMITLRRFDASGKPIGRLVYATPTELRERIRALEAQVEQQARVIRELCDENDRLAAGVAIEAAE